MIEDSGYDKYMVRVDGSGRVVNRNRRYLRSFKPAMTQPTLPATRSPIISYDEMLSKETTVGREEERASIPAPVRHEPPSPAPQPPVDVPTIPEPPLPTRVVDSPTERDVFSTPPTEPRRSGRIGKPNPRYNEKEFDLSSVTVVETSRLTEMQKRVLMGRRR